MNKIRRQNLRQMRLKGKKYLNIMQKLCFQYAKCGILKRETQPFTKQNTAVLRAKSSDLQPFSGVFNMRKKIYHSFTRHKILIIKHMQKKLKNASFFIRNVIPAVRLQKVR